MISVRVLNEGADHGHSFVVLRPLQRERVERTINALPLKLVSLRAED